VAGAPLDESDITRSDWKTAPFGRGSQRGCRVSADLSVQNPQSAAYAARDSDGNETASHLV